MRKAFAFYFLVQIYASGSLTPVVRNDNVNNNEALQSHILSFSLDFAAKLYRLLKMTKQTAFFLDQPQNLGYRRVSKNRYLCFL